jgi:nucleoside-diphosphate-sugar epimerase
VNGRVLVSGASGFIGRHLIEALREAGYRSEPVLRGARAGEYQDRVALEPADALIHLAFPTDHAERAAHPAEARAEAAAGTARAMEIAARAGARAFILASSGKLYGNSDQLPVAENAPPRPTTELGRLKALAEDVARSGSQAARVAVTSVRLFNVYGPGQKPTFFVAKLVEAARSGAPITLGELDHRRDWVHVRDVTRAFGCVLAMAASSGSFRALNVGSGRSTSAREVLAMVELASSKRIDWRPDANLLRPGEADEERADITAMRELGWSPAIDLDAGLRDMLSDRERT